MTGRLHVRISGFMTRAAFFWRPGLQPVLRPAPGGQLYGFPEGVNLAGQTIGLIELGGARPADITKYFKGLGLPAPTMKSISATAAATIPRRRKARMAR